MQRAQVILIRVSKLPTRPVCEYMSAPTLIGNAEHLWTSTEVANYVGVHPETIRLWVRKRTISYIWLGKVDVRFH